VQQGESSQNKSLDTNILDRVVYEHEQGENSRKSEQEPENNIKKTHAFNLTKELEKVIIQVPLLELAKIRAYNKENSKFINLTQVKDISDTVNLQEEKPMVTFGPHVEEVDPSVPPFYISQLLHDYTLHNCMLDSGASHNLMPLSVMKELNLHITKPYRDLYSFDSKRVKCVGLIKDVAISLAQIPEKSIVMDVVVVDILARFGMLLSRYWGAKLGGVLKLDFTYAIISVFNGEERRLYRETRFVKTTSKKDVGNSPIYS